ncbi:MAG: type II toxin-antitoxin system RelE/ParE family toxin [Clostridiales bacterium]|jgi:mRNA interferase RelE/StbE|nr:type II toxin-antitoxin system RelE/ParE family toxin [Clostridiales bacterium]
MIYKIEIKKTAPKFIIKQPKDIQLRLYKAIYKLPIRRRYKQLKNQNNKFRLRVGDFRIIYSIFNDRLLIEILKIGNRGDVYKN